MRKNKSMLTDLEFSSSYDSRVHQFAANVLAQNNRTLEEATETEIESLRQDWDDRVEALYSLCRSEKGALTPSMSFRDALTIQDVGILFDEVVERVLNEPKQPNLFLQNQIATRMDIGFEDTHRSISFLTVGQMTADEIAIDGVYPQDSLSISEHYTQVNIRKWGVQTAITEEAISGLARYGMVGLLAKLAKEAVDRRVEDELYDTMQNTAVVIKDNNNTSSAYWTKGVNSSQTQNGTISYYDMVDMYSNLMHNGYMPSHVLGHPLGWGMFYHDPFMRAAFVNGGQIGADIWTQRPDENAQRNMPFGLTYVPYYAMEYATNTQTTANGSGEAAGITSDMYMIDKENAMYLITRGDAQMDEKEDWSRDAMVIKVRRYAGSAAKDAGYGMLRAKNIRVDRNYEPVVTIQTTS